MNNARPVFLTAEWSNLLLLNYEVDPALLASRIPAGTELDHYEGRYFVSLVGFQFQDTRIKGWPIIGHRNFEEVNLRFYVRRKEDGEWRRGVVFIKEIVPRWAIAFIARTLYGEPYISMPMAHDVRRPGKSQAGHAEYRWRLSTGWNRIHAELRGVPVYPEPGSLQEFIIEHYWGYTKRGDRTDEYAVEHSPWKIYDATNPVAECHIAELYGNEFVPVLSAPPTSAFMAEGSPVVVRSGRIITT